MSSYLDHPPPRSVVGDAEDELGFLPLVKPAAKLISRAFRGRSDNNAVSGGDMGNDFMTELGANAAEMLGFDDASIGYDGDEVAGQDWFEEDAFLHGTDADLVILGAEEDASLGDDPVEVGAGRQRLRNVRRRQAQAQEKLAKARGKGRGKRAQRIAKRLEKLNQLERKVQGKQAKREGRYAASQGRQSAADGGEFGGFGLVPGFGSEGNINEIPFLVAGSSNDYQQDSLAAGAGVRTVGTVSWETPSITYSAQRLIGVRILGFISQATGGVEPPVGEMRLTAMAAQGGIDALYGAVRAPYKLNNDLGVAYVDHIVRVLRDNPTIDRTQKVTATTVARAYQTNAAALLYTQQLSAITTTLSDPAAARST